MIALQHLTHHDLAVGGTLISLAVLVLVWAIVDLSAASASRKAARRYRLDLHQRLSS